MSEIRQRTCIERRRRPKRREIPGAGAAVAAGWTRVPTRERLQYEQRKAARYVCQYDEAMAVEREAYMVRTIDGRAMHMAAVVAAPEH